MIARIVATTAGSLLARHPDPLVGDLGRAERRVPGEAPEGVPVGLREVVPAPVAVAAGVGDAGDAGAPVAVQRAVEDPGDGASPGPWRVGVGVEELLPHRRQVHQVRGEWPRYSCVTWSSAISGVFGIAPKSGLERLARLEVERAVLHLHEHVVAELAVERHELEVGPLDAVRIHARVE